MKIEGYTAEVDPLHRNYWPVRSEDTGFVVGEVVEHITATLDLPQPPVVRWSWRLDDAEAERLGERWIWLRESPPRYVTYDQALEVLTTYHRIATRSARDAEPGVRELTS